MELHQISKEWKIQWKFYQRGRVQVFQILPSKFTTNVKIFPKPFTF
jgi:hypothetical protein